jgi:hypothetical protein
MNHRRVPTANSPEAGLAKICQRASGSRASGRTVILCHAGTENQSVLGVFHARMQGPERPVKA